MTDKCSWSGLVTGVQPRIRLTRSFDQRQHTYLGYVLFVEGLLDGGAQQFSVGIGKAAQAKHCFRVGDSLQGSGVPPSDPRTGAVDLYKVSGLRVQERGSETGTSGPPWTVLAPTLEVYRQRGHRRLAARTYAASCRTCVWGCDMPVEMIIDQWNPGKRRYRRETICYGPKSCKAYRAGPTRKVPGRKGMSYEEEDWVDEEATAHRGLDD